MVAPRQDYYNVLYIGLPSKSILKLPLCRMPQLSYYWELDGTRIVLLSCRLPISNRVTLLTIIYKGLYSLGLSYLQECLTRFCTCQLANGQYQQLPIHMPPLLRPSLYGTASLRKPGRLPHSRLSANYTKGNYPRELSYSGNRLAPYQMIHKSA